MQKVGERLRALREAMKMTLSLLLQMCQNGGVLLTEHTKSKKQVENILLF